MNYNRVAFRYAKALLLSCDNDEKLKTVFNVESNKLKEIENKVKQLTSKNVNLTNHIDENIVGGFILRVGDLQYNASLKDQLKKLEQEFLNISIQ